MAALAVSEDVEHLWVAGDAVRTLAACGGLFALCGFGLVRLALPDDLRRHELLWVLPVGACAAALELSVLGYLGVPLRVNAGVVAAANIALTAVAIRRRGLGPRPAGAGTAWPAWIALLLIVVALVPMLRAAYTTVQGFGSDAHLAVGTAHFLKGHAPGEVAPAEPVDRVPLVWRSKPPIYYPMAVTAGVANLETWQVFSTMTALMLALAALGFFLLAREGLGAGLAGATVAMAVVGLDRVVLHTAMHPYYNQLWGFFTLPFALLLAFWVARSGSRGAAVLLALFLAVGAFAYPLAVPIVLVALVVALWPARARLRSWASPRMLWWAVPLALVLAVPTAGVVEKALSAAVVVLDPTRSLLYWGGDLSEFVPEYAFVALPSTLALAILGVPLAVAIARELRHQPRTIALALGGVLLFGALVAVWFRPRESGWYFHFKALAFVGPIAVLLAVVAVSRLRGWVAAAGLATLLVLAGSGARDEVDVTLDQTPLAIIRLHEVEALVPDGASIRLDVPSAEQLWVAYMLAEQPLCSEYPLRNTSYPHVPVSRAADHVLVKSTWGRPSDAVGPALWRGDAYTLYALPDDLPGPPENCSQTMVQTVTAVPIT